MKKMKRVVLVVLDGVGCGAQADAARYGDEGANTLGHVYEQEKPDIPNLAELGLLSAAGISAPDEDEPIGCYGVMTERAAGNEACVDAIVEYMKKDHWRGLLFANLVDTDMLYGHRNDVAGFARCLEAFDRRLPEILRLLGEDGMLLITADHGCDPAFPTTDHTRERVPVLAWGLGLQEGVPLGVRDTFADVSATVLEALGARARLDGTSFYDKIAL